MGTCCLVTWFPDPIHLLEAPPRLSHPVWAPSRPRGLDTYDALQNWCTCPGNRASVCLSGRAACHARPTSPVPPVLRPFRVQFQFPVPSLSHPSPTSQDADVLGSPSLIRYSSLARNSKETRFVGPTDAILNPCFVPYTLSMLFV